MNQLPDISEFLDCLVILLSNDRTILNINQAALDTFGWQRPDVLHKDFTRLFRKCKFKNPLPHPFPFGQTLSLKNVITILKKKNKKTFISWSINSLGDDNSLHQEIILVGYNITARKKLEENVYELDSIIAQMPGNVYWYDKNHVYLGCNENSAKTLGMSREEAVGKDFVALMKMIKDVPESSIKKWVQDGVDVMRSKKPKLNIPEIPFVGPDNHLIYTVTNKVPLFDKEGKISGILGISTDITHQKNIERNLKKSKEKAEAANRAKTEFLSNMSHDVKTPLAGIIAFSELLSFRVPPELYGITKDLLNAGKRLMVFFENCIELSKLDNRLIILTKEDFNLKELLNEIIQLFKPSILAKRLSLQVNYSTNVLSWVRGTRMAIYRVMLNLLGNAVKFTKSGSITISIELNKKSTSEKTIIDLKIADTGIGISEDMQEVIFEKFARLAPSYQGTYEGHGIGLYLVKEFVKSMQGEVHLESKVGEGSQFTVSLPLQMSQLIDVEEVDLEKILPEEIPDADEVKVDRNNLLTEEGRDAIAQLRVLFVEDNVMAQIAGKQLFEFLGYQVDVAENGAKGIALFKPGKYVLAFVDIGLSDLKGYEVSKRFRVMEEHTASHTPILGLSAHASLEEKQLSTQAGMDEMLPKPLLLDQARAVLKRYANSINRLSGATMENSQNITLSATGESGLKIISLEKNVDAPDAGTRSAWKILADLDKSLSETRTEIELSYKAGDLKKLINEVHKLHGGLCYTNTPDFLQATRTLEISLKNGDHDKLDIHYKAFIKAMETFEKFYQSLQGKVL